MIVRWGPHHGLPTNKKMQYFENPYKKKKVLFSFQVPKNERKDQTIWVGE